MSSPADILKAIATLRDVRGVEGSFVAASTGGVFVSDLPGFIDASVLDAVWPRIQRLREALLPEGEAFESCQLRYRNFSLRLLVFSRGVLCLMLAEGTNKAALRMAANIAVRKLDNLLQAAGTSMPKAGAKPIIAAAAPPANPAAAAAAPAAAPVPGRSAGQPGVKPTTKPQFYRGRRVD